MYDMSMKHVYLKTIREERGLSVRQLAKMAGISHDFLARHERFERKLSPEILLKIAKALQLDGDALLVAYGHLPDNTEEARNKDPHTLLKSIRKTARKIMDDQA